ncbi:MAG: MFS transporter [Chloroflexi bacterium]|nr:MFS transporter [Chloroflexota bacterium]MCL5110665.1 MFS transporter [Chloroflexota bacterium]
MGREQPAIGQSDSDRRERLAWYFYDWANSAFPTTVVTVFLGPYLTTIAKAAADAEGYVRPLGIPIAAGAFYPYIVALSVGLQVLFLPVLGAIADYSHLKKQLLGGFAYLGALATAAMFFLEGTNYLLGGALFLLANLSFGAAVINYNAFLPEISSPEERDAVSSNGWALGYLGGGLLLALNLALFTQAGALGLSSGDAARICLSSAGVWWGLFTLVTLAGLRSRRPARSLPPGQGYLTTGFRQLVHTLRSASAYPQTLLFLVAYLFYNDGIQTVIALSGQFGQEEMGLSLATLPAFFLMVQFVAFFGALVFGRVAKWLGGKRAVAISLIIWTAALIYAYGFLHTTTEFFALGVVIAIVLGGSQALSRSVFSLMIPRGQEAEYFSLYEVSEKGTSAFGPLLFGLTLQLTGSYRAGILSPVLFFVVGFVLLLLVNVRQAAAEAGNQAPARV